MTNAVTSEDGLKVVVKAEFEAAPATQRDFALACLAASAAAGQAGALLPVLQTNLLSLSGSYVNASGLAVVANATTALLDFTVEEYTDYATDSVRDAAAIQAMITQATVGDYVTTGVIARIPYAVVWLDDGPYIPLPPPPPGPPTPPAPPQRPPLSSPNAPFCQSRRENAMVGGGRGAGGVYTARTGRRTRAGRPRARSRGRAPNHRRCRRWPKQRRGGRGSRVLCRSGEQVGRVELGDRSLRVPLAPRAPARPGGPRALAHHHFSRA